MKLALCSISIFALTATGWAQSATSQHQHGPIIIHERHGKNATSTNWSGYAVTGVSGSVTDVKGSWIVPTVNCSNSPSTSYASFWVGIDGYSSNTVEQIGTDSDCSSSTPTYYAWYEFYPHFAYYVPNMRTINAGDVMSAEVKYSGGMFTVTITDTTTGATYSKTQKVANAQRSSAEWIIEAPYSGGVLPLADFGTVYFGQDSTNVSNTCDATLAGNTLPIGYWGTAVAIKMVTSSGADKTLFPVLSGDGTSFSETWVNAGP